MATRKKTATKSVSKPGPKAAKPKSSRSRPSPAAAPDIPDNAEVAMAEVGTPAGAEGADAVSQKVPEFIGDAMKRKALIDEVVARSGIKKKDAKPVVETLLVILGEAIAEGRELNLQPFGRIKYKRAKENASSRVVIANIRQRKEPVATSEIVQEAVAEPIE